MFQVLPSSWQASLLASPFSSAKQQRSQQPAPMAPAPFGGCALALQDKLRCLAVALTARFQPGTFSYVQVWTSTSPHGWSSVDKSKLDAVVMRTDSRASCVSDLAFKSFAIRSLEYGISASAIGMLGKVWSSGALAVVQNVAIIPGCVHPRNKLDSGLTDRMAELAYIPIYDLHQPEAGVVACLEVAISASAKEALVANIISEAAELLGRLDLLLNKPEDMQRHASGGSSPRSSLSIETAVAAVTPGTPAHLPPLRVQPPPQQHTGGCAAAASARAGPTGVSSDGYPGTAPSSMPGSPVTGTSYSSSRSSTSSRAGSPTYRSSISRTSSTMARTQSIRCMEAADMLHR